MQSAPNLSIKTNQDRKQSLGATMSPTTPNDKERKASIVSVERANSIRSFESNQSKYNFRIPIWLVVFLQTFFIALLVVSIPLTISLRGTHESNLLSIAAGRNVSTTLGLIIQGDESANVANQLCIDFSRIVKIKLIDLANSELDKIYLYLWNIREATDNPAFYYYAFENGNFVQVVKVINPDLSYQYQLRIQLYTFPVNCSICPSPSVATNSSIRYAFPIDEATGLPDLRTVSIKEQLVYFAPIRPFYTLCKGKNTPQWLTPTPFSTPGTFGVTVCQGMNNRDGTISGVFAMNIQLSQLSFLFRSLRKTSTSFVYVLASDGTVVATSTGQNLAPNGPILKINSITDTEVKKTSSYLQETYPETKTNWASLTQLNIFSLNDTLFQTNQLQFENFKCLIVNGALRKDYVGDIDETLINLTNDLTKNTYMIIGIAIGTFVILVTFGVFFTYFAITRPLQSITRIMVAATKFEFTALKDKELVTRRSFISEFASMESSFFKMVKNFADSISNNRKLMGKSQSIGQGSNNGVNSTVLGSGGERRGSADMLRRPSEDPAPYRFMQGGRRPSRVDL